MSKGRQLTGEIEGDQDILTRELPPRPGRGRPRTTTLTKTTNAIILER